MSNSTESRSMVPALIDDPDFLRVLVERTVQAILEAEMTAHLGAAKYKRAEGRTGYRNGTTPRTLVTRVGTLRLAVPQDRDGAFSTELFARYQRSEQALVSTLLEMYVPGVSTRKVAAITEALCGTSFSKSQVSALTSRLDGDPRGIFAAGTRSQAVAAAGVVAERWRPTHPVGARRHEEDVKEALTCLAFPSEHRARIRTTNGLERLNQELRR